MVVLVVKGRWVNMIEMMKGRGGEGGCVDRFVLKKGESGWSRGWVGGVF